MTLRLSLASHFLYACATAQTPTKQDALGYPGVASHRSLTRRFHGWRHCGGEKIRFAPHEAQRCKERTQAERTNARLKDESGGRNIWVRGHKKVMSHMMFGILALTADQLMRLLT